MRRSESILALILVVAAVGCRREPKRDDFPIKIIPYEDRFYRWGYADAAVSPPTDEQGVPVRIDASGKHYSATDISYEMMVLLDSYYVTKKPSFIAQCDAMAKKLLEVATMSDGALFFQYDQDFAMHGDPNEVLRAPWYSGVGEGRLLSAFTRLYAFTKKPEYLKAAKQILLAIGRSERDARRGAPWVSYVDPNGYFWVEEYPGSNDHALLGFMIAIFGLYDFLAETGDSTAKLLLERTLTTLKAHLPLYRQPGKPSYYCLRHQHVGGKYHPWHVEYLEYVARYSGDPFFRDFARELGGDCTACGE